MTEYVPPLPAFYLNQAQAEVRHIRAWIARNVQHRRRVVSERAEDLLVEVAAQHGRLPHHGTGRFGQLPDAVPDPEDAEAAEVHA